MTLPASPTIGMCAGTFFEISAGSMSMWMNFAPRRELGELAGDAVVEAGADRADQVGAVHRVVGGPRPVHPEHAEPLRVACRGSAPRPISVQVTGKRSAVASSKSSVEAFALMTPPPA